MVQKKSTWHKVRNLLLATTSVFALVGSGSPMMFSQHQEILKQEKDSLPKVMMVQDPVQTITFRNDTLYQGSATLLYYLWDNITRNYVDKRQSYRMQLPYFAHEDKHHKNEKVNGSNRSYRIAYKYSPSQYAVLCMFDEVTANLVAIETAALEYITATNKDAVVKKYENTYMKFYFDAIKEGRIEPLKMHDVKYIKEHREQLEEYRSFMANNTQNMWERTFRKQYSPAQYNMVMRYIQNVGLYPSFNGNFNLVADHMWNIGGVNFRQYLDHTIEPYDTRIKLFDAMAYVHSFTKDKKTASTIVGDVSEQFNKLNKFAYSQQDIAFQHMFIASKLKNELQNFNQEELAKNPKYVAVAYRKVMYELSRDVSFHTFVKATSHIAKPIELNPSLPDVGRTAWIPNWYISASIDETTQAQLKEFYLYKGMDLTARIPNFNINLLPTSPESFLESSLNLFSRKDEDNLSWTRIIEQAMRADEEERNYAYSSVTTPEVTKAVEEIRPRRLSENMYMNILDFREPILEPEAMTEASMQRITAMFREFENIPSVFKNCDVEGRLKYEEEHGVSGYFMQKDRPFRPMKNKRSKNYVLTLAQKKELNQLK